MASGGFAIPNQKSIHHITMTVTTDQYAQIVSKPAELSADNFVSVRSNDYRYFVVASGWSNVRAYTTANQPVWAANTSLSVVWTIYS